MKPDRQAVRRERGVHTLTLTLNTKQLEEREEIQNGALSMARVRRDSQSQHTPSRHGADEGGVDEYD